MTDFLLEILSEEIPARMQAKAHADLERLFVEEIAKSGLAAHAIETHATPRRLALIARDLPTETVAVSEEVKGPRSSAPPQALEGFLRKTGLAREQLVDRDGTLFALIERPGRATADVLADAIPAIIRAFPWPKSMRWGAASSSTASLRWVRPLQGIVALFGDAIVPCEIDGMASGAETRGHRFHHPGIITIGNAGDYEAKLRACHVILSAEERQQIIRDGAERIAEAAGLSVVPDEGLVAENAGLTEWPVPLLGSFDSAFLAVPPEVIQLTMRTNQKYFALNPPRHGEGDHAQHGGGAPPSALRAATSPDRGGLAPKFICTANIEPTDGGAAIAAGNAKVLAARLSDAKFFWEQDLKVPLAEQAKKLDQIVFHEKLGTVADKVDRVAKLARWLVEEGIVPSPLSLEGEGRVRVSGVSVSSSTSEPPHPIPLPNGEREHLAALAEQAARLCKADLVTGMVGEFPELQGIMGGYYARAEGLPDELADAIRDHYKPVGQGDEVPTAPVTVAVSLADKLDTLVGFFAIGQKPTGSKDPYALRRAMLGIIILIRSNGIRFAMNQIVRSAMDIYLDSFGNEHFVVKSFGLAQVQADRFATDLVRFAIDRLVVQAKDEGIRHDLVSAAFELEMECDLVRLLARVKALQSFVSTEDGANLLAGYKRAANILKKEGWEDSPSPRRGEGRGEGERAAGERPGSEGGSPSPNPLPQGEGLKMLSYAPEPEEADLIAALDAAEGQAGAAVHEERFEDAMAALAGLRAPIDAFFDKVTVNDPDPAKRTSRLGLLARIRSAVHQVADFSKIQD